MNFFSKLFGFKDQSTKPNTQQTQKKQVENTKGQPFFTNAPSHWGVITNEFLKSNTNFTQNFDGKIGDIVFDKRMFMVNSLVLLGGINQNLSNKIGIKIISEYSDSLIDSKEQYATSCCVYKLFDKGIVMTNGVVIDNYDKYAVFLFANPTPITYIEKLKEKFIEDGFKDLIYYCNEDPQTIDKDPADISYVGLQKECFKLKNEQSRESRKHNDYALWWTNNPDILFSNTDSYKTLSKFHEENYDVNTYILGKIGFALGLNQNESRVKVPDYDELIIEGPEDVEIIVTVSAQTGINFHFPIDKKFERYRDNFLNAFVVFASSIKEQVIQHNFERDSDVIKPEWLEQTKDVENIESISLILSDKMLKYLN